LRLTEGALALLLQVRMMTRMMIAARVTMLTPKVLFIVIS